MGYCDLPGGYSGAAVNYQRCYSDFGLLFGECFLIHREPLPICSSSKQASTKVSAHVLQGVSIYSLLDCHCTDADLIKWCAILLRRHYCFHLSADIPERFLWC